MKLQQALADFIALTKPRIILLLGITGLAGSLVAAKGNPGLINALDIIAGLAGLCLSAGGANMLNMWWDKDIDPLMSRTKNRPIPAGRVQPRTAIIGGIGLIAVGFAIAATANLLTALCALGGALFYVLIYTMLLKRHTVQNIVIGGAAGAFPPLVGWAAVQNNLADPLPWLMFAIIFFWTPPHFWALALLANKDYTRAGVPMYPVVYGEPATRLAIIRYLLLLILLTLAGGLLPPLGWLYTAAAIGLGLWWGSACWQLLHAPNLTADTPAPARIAFKRSLYYLAFLFFAMVLDAWL